MSRPSESPRKAPDVPPHDSGIAYAKREMLDAFYNASPARVVEKHPLLSVSAVASASLAATVIVTAPVSRKFATAGVMQAVRSAMPLVHTYLLKRMQPGQPSAQPSAPPPPDA